MELPTNIHFADGDRVDLLHIVSADEFYVCWSKDARDVQIWNLLATWNIYLTLSSVQHSRQTFVKFLFRVDGLIFVFNYECCFSLSISRFSWWISLFVLFLQRNSPKVGNEMNFLTKKVCRFTHKKWFKYFCHLLAMNQCIVELLLNVRTMTLHIQIPQALLQCDDEKEEISHGAPNVCVSSAGQSQSICLFDQVVSDSETASVSRRWQ